MCGLFGFVHFDAPELSPETLKAARKALNTLTHRGPDQHGEHIAGNVYLGHRRLSILDLSEDGRQPMLSADGDVAITVNGEIYNHRDLRKEIGEAEFRSSSDSESLLHGYRAWGIEALADKADGMIAAVIYDQKAGRLHFLRDRAGIKPLLYTRLGQYFIWASELKAIVSFAKDMGLPLKVDNTALYDFLTYRYIPAEKTLYKDVFNLLPAHHMSLDAGAARLTQSQYWRLETSQNAVDHDVAAETLRDLIGQSVEEQLMGDVPVGLFLSGGMDSSILVAQAAQRHDDLATFSIGYDHKAHDETHYAKIVADQFKTRHHVEILGSDDAQALIPMILKWYDQPFGDNSALPTFHVSKFARQNATVALSGDGGDELFGGYRWYNRFSKFKALQPPFGKGPRFSFARKTSGLLQKLALRADIWSHFDPLEMYAFLIDGLPPSLTHTQREALDIPKDYDAMWAFRKHYRPDLPMRKRMQYLDFHTFLPDDILTKVDRVSMAVSLEARVPFLSRAIMEYAFSLPEDFLYKGGQLKGGLKYAFQNQLPSEILERDKKGFSIPLHAWKGPQESIKRFQESVYAEYRQQG